MFNLLVVDDELLVRNHLRTIMNWEQHGFVIAGEAANGQEALDYMAQNKTDAVLSDIRMPVMDGVELSREIQRCYPTIPFVMLSNFDDYAYVRSALQHGAVDYLLKHMLSEHLLTDVLQKIKSRIVRIENRAENPDYRVNATLIQALKQKFIIQLLSRFIKQEAEAVSHIQALRLPLDIKMVVPIVIEIDRSRETAARRGLKEEELLHFSILNIIDEVLSDNEHGIAGQVTKGRFVVLLSFAESRSISNMDHRVRSVVSRIDQCFKTFIKLKASFSIGLKCDDILQVPGSYEQACNKLSEKFYLGSNCMIYPHMNSEVLLDRMTGLDMRMERELTAALKLGNQEAVQTVMWSIFQTIRQQRLSPAAAQMIFYELLGIVNRLCRENQIEAESAYSVSAAPHEVMAYFETLEEIHLWLEGIFLRMIHLLHYSDEKMVSPNIRKAAAYMKNNLNENISLSEVAEQIGITAPYLSQLFKEEQGVGFLEYLMELRLDKAKALLLEEKLEMKAIASACGFNNYPYFFNVFKKRVGMTPGAYVKLNKS